MERMSVRALRPLRAACVFIALALAAGEWAYGETNGESAVHPDDQKVQSSSPSQAIPRAGKPGASNPPAVPSAAKRSAAKSDPRWSDLTPAQQQALSPLATEWDKLDSARKTKWLAIGNKYTSMTPDERQRVQERMRDWVKLTPEQRRLARENYTRARKLNPDQKSAHWEKYQQLPEEQKRKLAADSNSQRRIVTLPPDNQSKTKRVPPIKLPPKPLLEQSVAPSQPTSQSTFQSQSPPQPEKE